MVGAPRSVVGPVVVVLDRPRVVDGLVAEHVAELGEPRRVARDVAQPHVVAELVADVPEWRAVLLAERRADLLGLGRVGLVEVERDEAAEVPDRRRVAGEA